MRGERRFIFVPKNDGSGRSNVYVDRPGYILNVALMRRFKKALCMSRLQSQLHHRSAARKQDPYGFWLGEVIPSRHAKKCHSDAEILELTAKAFVASLYAISSGVVQPQVPAAA